MVAFCKPIRNGPIHSIALRRGLNGKIVIQLRYQLETAENVLPSDGNINWIHAGVGAWKDADADNLEEVVAVAHKIGAWSI